MNKKSTFKQQKKYSAPDVNELKVAKLKSEWDFEVFGLCDPYSGGGPSTCCPPPIIE